jgi:hypothetical protein
MTSSHLVLVVDHSYSMKSIREETESGLNTWLDTHRAAEGTATLDIFQFSDRVNRTYRGPLQGFEHYYFDIRQNTALYDGIGVAIDQTGDYLRSLPESKRPDSVIVAIMTDGMNTVHGRYSAEAVKSMIEHQRSKYSWEISFMGAGLEVAQQAYDLGFTHDHVTVFAAGSGAAASSVFASNARSGVNYRSKGFTSYASNIAADGSETFEEPAKV